MKISQLPLPELATRLRAQGLYLETGPFVVNVQSRLRIVAEGLQLLYADFPLIEDAEFADYHISIEKPRNLRRWFRPQVRFCLDGESPFAPLPLTQAFAVLESGLNWCIYSTAHQYLMIHGAAIERGGYAAILPAPPGSGKSTLCAALLNRGWRLLTDELTLIDQHTKKVVPLARPVSLKNESIPLIQAFAPHAVFGPEIHNTVKGTIAHMRPPSESVRLIKKPAIPKWVIFPKYMAGACTSVRPLRKTQAFTRIAESLVNYTVLGEVGFDMLSSLIDGTDAFEFNYSNLDEAVAWFGELTSLKVQDCHQQLYAQSA